MSKPDLSIFSTKKGCVVASLPFSPEQWELFSAVMDEKDYDIYPNAQIVRVVTKDWGINLKTTSLSTHRRKECLCYKTKEA